ncbi:hypothetical protein [Richelia sinica]|uniref:hypothetical protein n=1 Tax=Richelia sinica TaxID=1357545 RepID=UPI00168960BE|nr:hypothetical protein [Richelia sinica]MBD2667383.1 hypothetical protein [Richelia sinica FACHB-800]
MPATTRRRKTTSATTGLIPITDICKAESVTEQAFRLALMEIRPDDFDTVKAIAEAQKDMVIATLQATSKALPQTSQNPENLSQQELQPAQGTATEQPQKPQNSDIVASTPSVPTSQPQQSANGPNLPAALDELIATVKEDVQLADLILQFRNQQITQNKQARDAQLVKQLQESRIDTRHQVFDALRGFGSAVASPDLPELPTALSEEIKGLCDELGKQLSLS